MIKLHIPPIETYNSETGEFSTLPGGVFAFENSLKAISKWESEYCISFFDEHTPKTNEQLMYYFECMCMTKGFRREYLSPEVVQILVNYMEKKHTASSVPQQKSGRKERMTSELLYAYMVLMNVPESWDKWEINRLMMTMDIIGIKSNPKKKSKRSEASTFKSYSQINKARRAKYHTKG